MQGVVLIIVKSVKYIHVSCGHRKEGVGENLGLSNCVEDTLYNFCNVFKQRLLSFVQ
jgi:hypothetical protein